jgi:hypothetical protein
MSTGSHDASFRMSTARVLLLLRIMACSMTSLSSLTLPGQEYECSASMLSLEMASISFPIVFSNSLTNVQAIKGISSRRSRRGGITMGNTLSR